jgi:hypothetical protein
VKKWAIIIASLWGVLISADSASAQELELRIYAPAPGGTTIVLAGVGGSKRGILLDPSLDVANVEADLTIVTAGVATRSDWQDGRRECSQSSPSHLVTSEATSTPWPSGSLSMDWPTLGFVCRLVSAAHPRARPPTWRL